MRDNFAQQKREGQDQYLQYIDDQGQEVTEGEDSNNTEQHPRQSLFPRLAPDQSAFVIGGDYSSEVQVFRGLFSISVSPLVGKDKDFLQEYTPMAT